MPRCEQWSIGNETYASAIDDPDDALGRAYGDPTPIAFDLEWYATGDATATGSSAGGPATSRRAWCTAPSTSRASRDSNWSRSRHAGGIGGRRSTAGLGPLELPEVIAHTGVRAPFAFPDGTVSDLVLPLAAGPNEPATRAVSRCTRLDRAHRSQHRSAGGVEGGALLGAR